MPSAGGAGPCAGGPDLRDDRPPTEHGEERGRDLRRAAGLRRGERGARRPAF